MSNESPGDSRKAIEFDIGRSPPTNEDMEAERRHAEAQRAILRKKDLRFLFFAVISVISLLSFAAWAVLPTLSDPGVEPTFVAILGYFIPYFVFIMFFVGNSLHRRMIERPREGLVDLVNGMKPASPAELEEISGAAYDHPEISSYQAKVAAQRRPLVVSEVRAIQRWLQQRNHREATARKEAAARG